MRAVPAKASLVTRGASLLLLLASITLAACGHKSTTSNVGVGIGISLTAPSGTTIVEQGATLEIDATVLGDASNKGVIWTLLGSGSATSQTSTKYVYQAPAKVSGALTVTLTATAVADTTQTASVTITVNGTPQIVPPLLFPANYNTPYGAYIIVSGGESPFTWTLLSGTLPPGITLSGGTGATTAISGTPTQLGSSTFTIQVEDALSAKTTVTLTVKVTPQTACLVNGQFAYIFSGFHGGLSVARAGSMNIATDGTIQGEHDIKDAFGTRIAEQIADGTCTTTTQNRGTLRLVSPSNLVESFDFGANTGLSLVDIQENDGTPVVGTAQMLLQDPKAFSLAAIAGDFAFGFVGDNGDKTRLTVAGRLTLGATGLISAGQADSSSPLVPVAGSVGGQLSAPDANGRGTGVLTAGQLSLPVAYYVVDANTLFVVSNDSSTKTPRIVGRMNRQTGAGAFDSASLSGSSVMSLWGSMIGAGQLPDAYVMLARFSAGTSATSLATVLDYDNSNTYSVDGVSVTAAFSVAANGRGTMTVPQTALGTRTLVYYLSGPGAGFVIDPTSTYGYWGSFELQTGLPYSTFDPTYFLGVTPFPTSSSPVSLLPQVLFQSGALSGNVTGTYAIDPDTGRVLASVGRNILGGTGLVGYALSPKRIVLMGNGVNSTDSTITWMDAY